MDKVVKVIYPDQLEKAEWKEAEHPRVPAGEAAGERKPGEFAPKGEARGAPTLYRPRARGKYDAPPAGTPPAPALVKPPDWPMDYEPWTKEAKYRALGGIERGLDWEKTGDHAYTATVDGGGEFRIADWNPTPDPEVWRHAAAYFEGGKKIGLHQISTVSTSQAMRLLENAIKEEKLDAPLAPAPVHVAPARVEPVPVDPPPDDPSVGRVSDPPAYYPKSGTDILATPFTYEQATRLVEGYDADPIKATTFVPSRTRPDEQIAVMGKYGKSYRAHFKVWKFWDEAGGKVRCCVRYHENGEQVGAPAFGDDPETAVINLVRTVKAGMKGELARIVEPAKAVPPPPPAPSTSRLRLEIDAARAAREAEESASFVTHPVYTDQTKKIMAAKSLLYTPSAEQIESAERENTGRIVHYYKYRGRGRGRTVESGKKLALANLRKLVKSARIYKRIDLRAMESLLRDSENRFKSQFETGTSRGYLSPTTRREVESEEMGISEDAPDRMRPIYGYLDRGDGDPKGIASNYGEIIFRMKPSVRARTTFTLGDSLDHSRSYDGYTIAAMPVTAPTLGGLDGHVGEALEGAWDSIHYIECQIQGGAVLEEADKAYFTNRCFEGDDKTLTPKYKVIEDQLKARGIEVEYAPHDF